MVAHIAAYNRQPAAASSPALSHATDPGSSDIPPFATKALLIIRKDDTNVHSRVLTKPRLTHVMASGPKPPSAMRVVEKNTSTSEAAGYKSAMARRTEARKAEEWIDQCMEEVVTRDVFKRAVSVSGRSRNPKDSI